MKRILLFATFAALALVSCKKENAVTPEIKADKTEYTLPLAGTEETDFYVEFTANVDWTAALKDSPEWISISPKKGTAAEAGKIKIVAEANAANDPRSAVLVVTAGTAKQEFTLTQPQKDAFLLVESSAEIDSKGGTVTIKVMTNVDYTVTIPSDATWITKADTKAYGEQTVSLNVAKNDSDDSRTAVITVSAGGFNDVEFTIIQKGKRRIEWNVKVKELSDFVPEDGARLAKYGDYLLLANGSRIFALDPENGKVMKKIELPKGYKAQSLCVDDAGNVLFAANASWSASDMFRIYTVSSLDETTPSLLIEYNSANIWCSDMCNVRVKGNIKQSAVITAYASYSAYWMAWEVTSGKVGSLQCDTTPYTSNTNCGCVCPVGTSLADGLWFIGYGPDYNLKYCSNPAENEWSNAYTTGSSWMENYDCISTLKLGNTEYLAILASCHFNYDSTNIVVLNATNRSSVSLFYEFDCEGLVSRTEDYANEDWTDAGTFADCCLAAESESTFDVYYVDVNYGILGCLKIDL